MSDLVMRSTYLPPIQDAMLRQLAHETNTTKSYLIDQAITVAFSKDDAAQNLLDTPEIKAIDEFDFVLRSVYLPAARDQQLREISKETALTKPEIIRRALSPFLAEAFKTGQIPTPHMA